MSGSLLSLSPEIAQKMVLKDQKQMTSGDIVELTVTLPEAYKDAAPEFAKKTTSEWGAGRIVGWKKDQNRVVISLTSYEAGAFTIKPIHFYLDGVSEPVAVTEPRTVNYGSVEAKTTEEQEDIYEPTGVPLPSWVVAAIGSLILFAAGMICFAIIKKLKSRPKPVVLEIKLTPLEDFKKKVREILAKDHVLKGAFKPHYFALSESAKKFIGQTFKFDAQDKTTRELIHEMQVVGVREDLIKAWSEIFEEMDETKFTDILPDIKKAKSLSGRLTDLGGKTE